MTQRTGARTGQSLKVFLRQPDCLAAVLISLAIVWLHFYFLFHGGGFWRDEVNLINLANSGSLTAMTHDSFPVLMPLLVHGWLAAGLGHSDLSLRLLGVLVGLGIPAALWMAAWTARKSPPLLSLTLLGLNSTVIFYGDSLRAYGIGSVAIVLVVAAMCFFLNKTTWMRAGILAVAGIISVQALYQNAVLFAAICFGAWAVCARHRNIPAALKILAAAAAAASSFLPYAKIISGMADAAAPLRMGFMPATALTNLDSVLAFPLPQYLRVWELLALIVIGFGAASWFIRQKQSGASADKMVPGELPLFAGATLTAALAGFIGFLWYAALETQPWYFLPPAALAAMCFELGLPVSALPRVVRVAAFGLIMATASIATVFAQRDLDWHFTNVDRLSRQLMVQAAPEDFILVTSWKCGISFARYFTNATPWQTLPPLADHATHRYDLVREKMQTPNALQPLLDQMAATLQSGHRVWVVGTLPIPEPNAPPTAELPAPPLKNSGWSDMPYGFNWAAQAGAFLATHSLEFQRTDQETNRNVNFYENLQLFMASGWQTNSP